MGTIATKMAAAAAAAAAAVAARRAVEYGWTWVRGEDPPTVEGLTNDTDLRDLLVWSAVVVGSVVLARKIAASKTEQLLS